MAVYKANSWGRTRSPKNLAGPPGTAVVLESTGSNLKSDQTGYKTKGYATENQRFLHVLVTDANDGSNLTLNVMGYCHAFERWFELNESFDPRGANSAPQSVAITVGNSSRNDNVQLPSDREYRVYHIVGIDRVAFIGDDDDLNVFAACSTF
tara:strand:+ start:283 stop:738 length:456 start_codon:yes stop_codon:yes gene_type:complete